MKCNAAAQIAKLRILMYLTHYITSANYSYYYVLHSLGKRATRPLGRCAYHVIARDDYMHVTSNHHNKDDDYVLEMCAR